MAVKILLISFTEESRKDTIEYEKLYRYSNYIYVIIIIS
jgi:hypothetical protein